MFDKLKKNKQNSNENGIFTQNFKDKFKEFWQDVLCPDDCNCIVCGNEVPQGQKFPLCEECEKDFPFNNGKICVRCGSPMDNEAYFCLECQNNIKSFDFARSSLKYEDKVRKLILDMKFHNNRWIEKYFARLLADTYKENKMDAEVIVPVPISKEREAERGFNQSYLIAKHLAKILNLPLENNAIVKVKNNERQMRLTVQERRKNVVGAYKIMDRAAVKGKKVVVIDDILTTGSTMSEVARQLKIAGASAVYGLVVASPQYKAPSEEFVEQDLKEFDIFCPNND